MATHFEELYDGLARELIDHIEGTWSIRGAGIVAQIEIIVFWEYLADAVQNSESTVSAIEDADRAGTI